MKIKISGFVGLVLLMLISACSSQSLLKSGDKYFHSFDFQNAAKSYAAAVKKDPNNVVALQKLARSYVLMNDHINAENIYSQIVKLPASAAINKLYYGNELRANGKYADAIAAYKEYSSATITDTRGTELSSSIDALKTLGQDNKTYEVTIVPEINTTQSEMGPAIYKDNGLVYSSNSGKDVAVIRDDVWTHNNFYDIYETTGDQNGNLYNVKRLKRGYPNQKFHEGPTAFSPDFKEMYFTRDNYLKGKVKKSKDKIVKLKIMQATWDDNKKEWTNITELPFNSNEYSVGHPAISKDGKRMYFMSDMPGGYGETDIYVSYKDGSSWGAPINLGKKVNTAGREMFPTIAEDGTLYYSSDGKVGLGGLDLYSATYQNSEWTNITNLGAPMNTNADDFGMVFDASNEKGYFVSNRQGGVGSDDIYKFKKNGITLCGTVVDARSKQLLPNSEVKLYEGTQLVGKMMTGDKGEFCFPVLPNKCYKVEANKTQYNVNSLNACMKKEPQVVQIPLEKPGEFDLTVCVNERLGELGTPKVSTGSIVTITNLSNGTTKTCETQGECTCKFALEANTDYKICATKVATSNGQYDTICKTITTKGKVAPATFNETLLLTYFEENMVFKLENIYFDLNKWNIRPDAAVELDKLVAIMNRFPRMEVELSSHTDCRASMKYNDDLSTKRAQSSVNYVVSRGIASSRIIAAGYGERKLVNNCACEGAVKSTCTEQEHQMNRRTEVKVLKVK